MHFTQQQISFLGIEQKALYSLVGWVDGRAVPSFAYEVQMFRAAPRVRRRSACSLRRNLNATAANGGNMIRRRYRADSGSKNLRPSPGTRWRFRTICTRRLSRSTSDHQIQDLGPTLRLPETGQRQDRGHRSTVDNVEYLIAILHRGHGDTVPAPGTIR